MDMQNVDDRLIQIEIMLSEQARDIEDLNKTIITQGKFIDVLLKQSKYILSNMNEQNTIKDQSEETPPPHY